MKKILIGLVLILLTGSLVGACAPASTETSTAEMVKIVDSEGRLVEIPQPVERVVVLDHYGGEMVRALGAKDKIVGINRYMADNPEYWPVLKDVPSAGFFTEPNYEKIVELNPQVVITCDLGVPETETKLEPTGIKVVRLNFYKPKTFVNDIRTLGLLLGKEKEAQELIDFFQHYFNTVQERVGKFAVEEKTTVYYEGKKEYSSVAGSSGHHEAILLAGGVNIFAGEATGLWGTCEVSPEAILEKNPSAVWKYFPGSYIPANQGEMTATYDNLLSRPGWAELDAVKNNRVIIMNYWMAKGCGKLVTICYMAKLLYPDEFQDMSLEEVAREWIERFQGVNYHGGYSYPPEESIWQN